MPKLPPIDTSKSPKLAEVFSKFICKALSDDNKIPALISISDPDTEADKVPVAVDTSKVTAISASKSNVNPFNYMSKTFEL